MLSVSAEICTKCSALSGAVSANICLRIDFYAYLPPFPRTQNRVAPTRATAQRHRCNVERRRGFRLYSLLILFGIARVLIAVQGSRNGRGDGQRLADLIREQFGVRWTALLILALLVIIQVLYFGINRSLGFRLHAVIANSRRFNGGSSLKERQKRVSFFWRYRSSVFFCYDRFGYPSDWARRSAAELSGPTFESQRGLSFAITVEWHDDYRLYEVLIF